MEIDNHLKALFHISSVLPGVIMTGTVLAMWWSCALKKRILRGAWGMLDGGPLGT